MLLRRLSLPGLSVLAAVVVCGTLLAPPRPARAISVVAASSKKAVTTFAGGLGLDPAFTASSPLTVVLARSLEDGSSLALNGVVDNLTGGLWERFDVTLDGASFASLGSLSAGFGTIAMVEEDPDAVRIFLDPAEPFGLEIGDVDGLGAATDWQIDLGGLAVGDAFEIAFVPYAVPEPALGALLLAALLCAAAPRPVRSADRG